ncbi:winged helix-turn-helix domain-containing protein [Streptomyces sp. NPDC047108]|uniref:ArsR/SmtB family transcription factor n=1 Tax=Streptomyces sp. NPDC047108 TaxID=3155025 RepID=UPI0033E6B830
MAGSVPDGGERDVGVGLATVARLLSDPTRTTMCLALLDGRAWTARELARHAGVAPSTATGHLNLLVGGGILADERHGRHRYVRLAGPRVAALIEALAEFAPHRPPEVRSLGAASRNRALARARLCYDHLAGALGTAVTDAMLAGGLLVWDPRPELTAEGRAVLGALGVTWPAASRRPAVRACLDWTERRPHLGGAVGAALCSRALAAGWVTRIGTGRALALTEVGRAVLVRDLRVPADRIPTAGTTARHPAPPADEGPPVPDGAGRPPPEPPA